jgi:hypothetical protein
MNGGYYSITSLIIVAGNSQSDDCIITPYVPEYDKVKSKALPVIGHGGL